MTAIPTGYYLLSYHYGLTNSSRPAVTTLGVQYTGTDLTTDAGTWNTRWRVGPNGSVNGSYVYLGMKVHADGGEVLYVPDNAAGGKVGAMAPPNCTYIINKDTVNPGRKGRGRMFLPGVNEAEVDNTGLVLGSMITELNNSFDTYRADLIAAHAFPVVLHNNPTIAPYAITDFRPGSMIGVMDRRLKI